MIELERLMQKMEKAELEENQTKNRKKQLKKELDEIRKKQDTKRKVSKGEVLEKFEKAITGREEKTLKPMKLGKIS